MRRIIDLSQGPSGFHEYRLRTLFEEVPLPMSWPVLVNYHEAKAFAKWKTINDEQVTVVLNGNIVQPLWCSSLRPASIDTVVLEISEFHGMEKLPNDQRLRAPRRTRRVANRSAAP